MALFNINAVNEITCRIKPDIQPAPIPSKRATKILIILFKIKVLISSHSVHKSSNWCSIVRELRVLKDKGFDFSSHCIKRVGDGNNTFFWSCSIVRELRVLKDKGFDFISHCIKRVGDGNNTFFWSDTWKGETCSGGREQQQWLDLASILATVSLSSVGNQWKCNLSGDGSFRVRDVRNYINAIFLPSSSEVTRWVKSVPIKINIFAWRARRDCLPTRANLIHRGVNVDSALCPICLLEEEDVHHILFRCQLAQAVLRRVCRWWDLEWLQWDSFSDWNLWFSTIHLKSKVKSLLEGVFNVAWWSIWVFRNRVVFYGSTPSRSLIFDDIVDNSFHWSFYRCNRMFSWEDWYKNPHLISL
nr:RNA-directed DNA polymerase, eukaryota [Tanacetum cinerariifolium]